MDATQRLIPIPGWRIDVPVIIVDGRAYFPVRALCAVLGIRAQMQTDRLREHEVLSRFLRQLPMRTPAGLRDAYCIERRGVAWWLGSISASSVRVEIRPRIIELQEALVDMADRLLSGEVEADPVRRQLATHEAAIADVTAFALSLERRIGHIEGGVYFEGD